MLKNTLLTIEFIALFLILPLLYFLRLITLPLIPSLIVIALVALFILLKQKAITRSTFRCTKHHLLRIILIFIPFATILTVFAYLYSPESFLYLPRYQPGLWILIMILYPIFSVLPQGIIYRAFLFHRYKRLFVHRASLMIASTAAFSFVHILFYNQLAVILTLAGGALFAYTYQRTQSLALSSLEHALYGCLIFTNGLGWYFYAGSF